MNEDERAKAAAKQQRQAAERQNVVTRESAQDAAARLDVRIAGQRRDYNGSTDADEKNRSRLSADATTVYRQPPSGLRELNRLEADAASKSSARVASGGVPSRPGSYHVAAPAAREQLSGLEADVLAKTRSPPSAASPAAARSAGFSERLSQKEREFGANNGGNNQQSGALAELEAVEQGLVANSKARPANVGARPGAYAVRSEPSGRAELDGLENDLVANAKARPPATNAPPAATSFSPPSHLTSLESDVAAKNRARAGGNGSDIRSEIAQLQAQATGRTRQSEGGSAPAQLSRMEADVEAKSRARNLNNDSAVVTRREAAARTELTRLEQDVAAKTRTTLGYSGSGAAAGAVAVSSADTAGRIELRNMEQAIARKEQSVPEGRARNELNQLEADIHVKQEERHVPSNPTPGFTNVPGLDERIAYKTGIPLDNEEKNDAENPVPVPEGNTSLEQSVSKLTGLSPETISSALEKFQGQQHPGDIAIPQSKLDTYEYQRGLNTEQGDIDMDSAGGQENMLAVAVAIKDDEDDAHIPAAIEYDPDAKPPIHKNRRFRLYGVLSGLLFLLIAAGIASFSFIDKGEVLTEPTVAPTSYRYNIGIQEKLELVVGVTAFDDPDNAYSRALEWIISEDGMELDTRDPHLTQRFLLAFFYFQSHESGDWLSCNAQPPEKGDDFCNFKQLVEVFPKVYQDRGSYRWLSARHECYWAGVFCDEFGQLGAIDLTGQNIGGTLPEELTYFPYIQSLALAWNDFTGTLPRSYVELRHLLSLEVHYNQLTGLIPDGWTRAKNLQAFNIASNFFTGTLPSSMNVLSNLRGLFLYENTITGTLPPELFELSVLTFTRMHRNALTGTLPTQIGNLGTREFWLHRNPLTGTIPSEVGNMDPHSDLRLHSTQLSGTIPVELYQLTDLWRLDLYETQVSGRISFQVSKLTNMRMLRLRRNNLTGEIPLGISKLTKLQSLWLEGNNFEGEISQGICDLREIENGLLDELIADCLPLRGTDFIPIKCSCCDICCERDTGECDG